MRSFGWIDDTRLLLFRCLCAVRVISRPVEAVVAPATRILVLAPRCAASSSVLEAIAGPTTKPRPTPISNKFPSLPTTTTDRSSRALPSSPLTPVPQSTPVDGLQKSITRSRSCHRGHLPPWRVVLPPRLELLVWRRRIRTIRLSRHRMTRIATSSRQSWTQNEHRPYLP